MKIIVDTSISYYSIEKLMCALFGQLCIVRMEIICLLKRSNFVIYKVQLKFSKDLQCWALRKPIVRKIGVALAINRIEFDYTRLRR